MAGWWGGPPQFTGNVQASQFGKSVPSMANSAPSNDVPLEYDIFHNSPQCPNCANIWHSADVTTHGLAIATGAIVATPFAPSAAPFATEFGSTMLTSSGTIFYNPEFWQAGSDFLEGAMPVGLAPATYAAGAGQVAGYYWDNFWSNR